MFRVKLKEGTKVKTFDGKEVGEVQRFVLDPETNEVTHIVVGQGGLFSEDKVVPFDKIRSALEDEVVLSQDIGNLDDLPPFEETYYVRVNDTGTNPTHHTADYPTYQSAPVYYWYPPHGYPGYPAYGLGYPAWPPTETHQNIPANTVPLKEGTDVVSSDGKHVGDVEQLFVEPASSQATHFLISQGVFFKDRKLVPASWIKSVTDDGVELTVSSDVLERLPSYQS